VTQGRTVSITSVSETIRKPPLAKAQTALGKQKKYVLWNADVCPFAELLWKTVTACKNFVL